MLLITLAGQLNDAADRLPLPDMIQPTPALAKILEDEIRTVEGLLNNLSSESAFRFRAGSREPLPPAAHIRQTTTALVKAAEPVGAALRDLDAAVSCLAHADDCRHRSAGPEQEQALAFAREGLLWTIVHAHRRLVHAVALLRTAAEHRTPSPPRQGTTLHGPRQAKRPTR
ncbi:hypothetical protein ACH4S8_08410 [Streptomyces sp. NPDC021080]|uniref:hypothetical protein n=1 Tax=Streptomyces sp. NPDC021080 TaxID=3365110 RepID=UPI003788022E